MTLRTLIRLLCAVVLLFSGCDRRHIELPELLPLLPYLPPAGDAAAPVIRDSAGIQVVHNGAAAGAWSRELLELKATRTIGVVEGDVVFELDDISSIALDDIGNVFAGSGKAANVLVFDSAGRFVRSIGRKGKGPGEFGAVNRLWLSNDTLVVVDTVNYVTTLMRPDGWPLQLWSIRHEQGTLRPWASGPDGWIAFLVPRRARFPAGMYERGDTVEFGQRVDLPSRNTHRYLPGSGTISLRLHELPTPPIFVHTKSDRYFHAMRPLFTVEPSFGFDRLGRLYLTSDTTYQIDVFDPNGRLVRRITREYTPLQINERTAEELDAAIHRHYSDSLLWGARNGPPAGIKRRAKRLPIPSTMPPLGRIQVSPDGSLWVERTDAVPAGQREFEFPRPQCTERACTERKSLPFPTRWDLFDADGRFLGTAETPPRFVAMAARGLELTGILKDDFMVEYIVTYRVTR